MEQKTMLKEEKDIKLLVDAHVFDDIYQGSRTFLKGIYSNLHIENKQITVYLVANNINNLKTEFKDIEGLKFIKLKYRNKYLRLAYEIPKLISDLKIDFAHFNYYLPLILKKNCKYIVTIHDVLFLDYPQFFPQSYYLKNKFFFKRSAKKADIITTVSNYSVNRISKHFKINKDRIYVLPNAINDDFRKNHDKEKHKKHIKEKYNICNFILYVSRLEPRKNHEQILDIYDELELYKRGVELVFIGKRSIFNPKLHKKMTEVRTKAKNKLHYLEVVDEDDLIPFYNAATLAVFPSLCEGFGIPPLESGALKTPTICSNTTAMSEFKFFGKNHINPLERLTLINAIKNELDNAEVGKVNTSELDYIAHVISKKYNWTKTAQILTKLIHKYSYIG